MWVFWEESEPPKALHLKTRIPWNDNLKIPMVEKLNEIENEDCIGNLGAFLMLLESPQQVRFNRVYFKIFRPKMWKILIF